MDLTYLLYSHESYKDILDLHIKQMQKHLPSGIRVIIAFNNANYINHKYNMQYDVFEYDDAQPYCERVRNALTTVKTKYVLFALDANVMIDSPKDNILHDILDYMNTNNVDQVRLFASGIRNPMFDTNKFHKITESDYNFSVNSAVWNTSSLYSIYNTFADHPYRCAECGPIQAFTSSKHNYYLSSEHDIFLEHEGHVISHYFPFCHVTSNGKWVMRKNKQTEIMTALAEEYGIDMSLRGVC